MTRFIIFSDLDGTLLDHHTYSHEPARPALHRIKETRTPLVLVSSKTRPEMEVIRIDLDIHDPFVPENGGAVFIPVGGPVSVENPDWADGKYQVLMLGKSHREIAPLFDELARSFPIKALSRLTAEEVAAMTGLTVEQAGAAKNREFGEAFFLEDPSISETALREAVSALGLNMTRGGRFHHLLGDNDKGKAVRILSDLYRRVDPDLVTVAIGDAPNDQPMLAAVDRPFLVAGWDRTHRDVQTHGLVRVKGSGPAGFNEAVLGLLDQVP